MTYLLLALAFAATASLVAVVAHLAVVRGGVSRARPTSWQALTAAAVALLVLTAVFDNVMIATGLIAYSDAHISGVRIGLAPVEDFAYPLAAVVLLPALWSFFASRSGDGRAR
ncbi:lycopene cyclase domain-containing protein [Promicromonospora sp. Populi]|uniref:lycopene cyclase domain-containing protein n=1 Tax=Promicromonospora sp. Populi TaxID=3239420 RepID=UPI0034E2D892